MATEEPEGEDGTAGLVAGKAGIAAQQVWVANQTVNLNGKPEWIQTLSVEQLEVAKDRLYRASRHHETYATMPIILPLIIAMVLLAAVSAYAKHVNEPLHGSDPYIVGFLGCLLALPVWFAMYDVRRRSRHVVQAAERRWAEVVVELALRDDRPCPPKWRLPRRKRSSIGSKPGETDKPGNFWRDLW